LEQHEADLIRDLIKANRDELAAQLSATNKMFTDFQQGFMKVSHAEVVAKLDDQNIRIAKIEADIKILAVEYESVLVEQKAAKLAADIAAKNAVVAAERAKANAAESEANFRRNRRWIVYASSSVTAVVTLLPYILRFLGM